MLYRKFNAWSPRIDTAPAKTSSAASIRIRPAQGPGTPARRAAGHLARAVHEGQDAPPGIGAPERVTITGRKISQLRALPGPRPRWTRDNSARECSWGGHGAWPPRISREASRVVSKGETFYHHETRSDS